MSCHPVHRRHQSDQQTLTSHVYDEHESGLHAQCMVLNIEILILHKYEIIPTHTSTMDTTSLLLMSSFVFIFLQLVFFLMP